MKVSFANGTYDSCHERNQIIKSKVLWRQVDCSKLYGQTQRINILDVDLTNQSIAVIPATSRNKRLASLTAIANSYPTILGGINGGFFYNGHDHQYNDPICPKKTFPQDDLGDSLLQIDGQVISATCDDGYMHARSALGWTKQGFAYIQLLAPYQAFKNLSLPEPVIDYALGGGPQLVAVSPSGQGFINIPEEGFTAISDFKAARTAVGLTPDKHLLLVTVDGNGHIAGMTLPELADFMLHYLQVSAAMNLDGGGSTTMCVSLAKQCVVVNHPSDGKERPIHNGLLLIMR